MALMAQLQLQEILNQINQMDVEELQQLNQAIQKCLVIKKETTNQTAFHQALLNSGLVKQIKRHSCFTPTQQQLIQVEGKPISETIVEERR
ncbi:hypothetical protein Ava_4991 [Trichormus variabilis ATCC 29413]|uniref:Uncharacterized protein n=2 Tax=Anabaena variabilis TaxID=264691 RepID=Q3M348_TRIV2|nr:MULTISPECIES: hypothetical protein [Nostocaceae]ABA24588.1 hypothetical protein Ava_4991 [Trichormus variabilis ATCC 29413]